MGATVSIPHRYAKNPAPVFVAVLTDRVSIPHRYAKNAWLYPV